MTKLRNRILVPSACLVLVVACGSSGGGSDRIEEQGLRDRAVAMLVDWGLPADEAACIGDELGASTVVESPDVAVLADSTEYRVAAEECIG